MVKGMRTQAYKVKKKLYNEKYGAIYGFLEEA